MIMDLILQIKKGKIIDCIEVIGEKKYIGYLYTFLNDDIISGHWTESGEFMSGEKN